MGSMRDLDQIQERDDAGRSSKLMSIALGGMAAACVLFAVGVIVGRESGDPRPVPREDPPPRLDQLAQQPERGAPAPSSYAEHLTGTPAGNATTAALAMAEGATARPAPGSTPTAAGAAPALAGPSLADPGNRPVLLPSAPVGAPGSPGAPGALGSVPGGIRLHDASSLPGTPAAGGAPVAPGTDGVLTVQVSAFRSQGPAEGFAQRLRERGYHAYVAQPATGPGGVLWHRVRVGPFANAREAALFRTQFEQREHMPTLLIRRPAPDAVAARRPAAPAAP